MVSQVNDLRTAAAGINNRQPVIAHQNKSVKTVSDTQQADPLRLSRTLTPEHTRQQSLIQRAQQKMAMGQVAERSLQEIGNALGQLNTRLNQLSSGRFQAPKQQAGLTQHLEQLKQHMESSFTRAEFKGQAVLDRHLKPVMQGEAQTQFRLRGLDTHAKAERDENIIFNFAKGGASAVPVKLEQGSTPEQQAFQFRRVFNPQGIGVGLDSQRQLFFTASEGEWQHLKEHMRVVGQGERFPAGQANKAKLESVSARFEPENWKTESKEQRAETQREAKKMLMQVKKSLQEIRVHNREVQQRVDDLNAQNGQLASLNIDDIERQLSAMLDQSDQFSVAYHHLKAQAHVHRHTVVSLLSE